MAGYVRSPLIPFIIKIEVNGYQGCLFLQIRTGRLVRDEVIDPSAFRVYLHAWRVLDAFNFTSPPCTIIPDPGLHLGRFTQLHREGGPDDLYIIQPAPPIQLVQTSFFAKGYGDVTDQIEFVKVGSVNHGAIIVHLVAISNSSSISFTL